MSSFTGNTVTGYALIDTSASPNLILFENFGTPVPIAQPGAGFAMTISVNHGNNSGKSTATVVIPT